MVAALSWPTDDFDERFQVLAWLAFIGWTCCLTSATYDTATVWRDRCVQGVLAQDTLRSFMAVPFHKRSTALSDRFLSDPSVLLATDALYERERNVRPREIALEALAALTWISKLTTAETPFYYGVIATEISLSLSICLKHLGRFAAAEQWLEHARSVSAKLPRSFFYLARCEFIELALAYERNRFDVVLPRIGRVLDVLREEGAFAEYECARFLEACALKNAGRLDDAASRLAAILKGRAASSCPLVYFLAHVALAEVLAKVGRLVDAKNLFQESIPRLSSARSPLAIANLHSTLAEVLRDEGHFAEAIESYRRSVAVFEDTGMARGSAYIRVLLAETLVLASREAEAIEELVKALPAIRSESLDHEAQAAMALLKESIRRQRLDAGALNQLRNQLRALSEGSEP